MHHTEKKKLNASYYISFYFFKRSITSFRKTLSRSVYSHQLAIGCNLRKTQCGEETETEISVTTTVNKLLLIRSFWGIIELLSTLRVRRKFDGWHKKTSQTLIWQYNLVFYCFILFLFAEKKLLNNNLLVAKGWI